MTSQFSVFFLLILFASDAYAFINIEKLRNSKKEGATYKLSISAEGETGNTETEDYLGEMVLYNRIKMTESLALVSYRYGESQNQKDENQTKLHLRRARMVTENLAYEYFGQYEKDEFTRLSFRGLVGLGLRQQIYKTDKVFFYFGYGVFYSSETLEEKSGTSDDGTQEIGRGNVYLAFGGELTDHLTLSSSTYFQPNFQSLYDHRAHENLELTFKVQPSVNISLFWQVSHDNEPPELVKTTDSYHGTKLVFLF